MPLVEIPGARLNVEDDGDGVPLLIPTGGGIPFYRNTFSRDLLDSFRFIYVEMRGTGASTGSIDGATFASLAADLETVRRALAIARPVVLGHSNHGCIALEYGLAYPGSCAGVVSLASGPDFRANFALGSARFEAEADSRRKALFADLQSALSARDLTAMGPDEAALERYLALAPLGWRDPGFDQRSLWGAAPRGLAAYLAWMQSFSATWDVTSRLPGLRVPLLAICGRYDYLCPKEPWERAIHLTPNATLSVFKKSAHNPQHEQPESFANALQAFAHGSSGPRWPRESA